MSEVQPRSRSGKISDAICYFVAFQFGISAISLAYGHEPWPIVASLILATLLTLPPVLNTLQERVSIFGYGMVRPFAGIATAVPLMILYASFNPSPSSPQTSLASSTATDAPEDKGALEAFVLDQVQQHLRDPASAKLSNVTAYRSPPKLSFCGFVNAKNGFGGYTGPEPFILADGDFFIGRSATPARQAAICTGSTSIPLHF